VLACQETNSEIGQKATEHLAAYSALLANGNDQFRQVAIL